MRKITKFKRSIKAISPIISVLLMIAIAVVAALVVYAWVMGYIGYQTGKTGDAVQIQSVTYNTPGVNGEYVTTVYLQNVGSTSVTLIPAQCLYINGILDTSATTPTSLTSGSTATINAVANTPTFNPGATVTIKVTTQGGTYSQITEQAP
ncbi:MAG: archaellin/type IV pilin N-terminal domain-containing protein [Candidatus Bathyarchaeia archaeon]